jgi:hypothetical protein
VRPGRGLGVCVAEELDAVAGVVSGMALVLVIPDADMNAARDDGSSEASEEGRTDVACEVLGGLVVSGGDMDGADAVFVGIDADTADAIEGPDQGLRLGRQVGHRHWLPSPAVHVSVPPLQMKWPPRRDYDRTRPTPAPTVMVRPSYVKGAQLKLNDDARAVKGGKSLGWHEMVALT